MGDRQCAFRRSISLLLRKPDPEPAKNASKWFTCNLRNDVFVFHGGFERFASMTAMSSPSIHAFPSPVKVKIKTNLTETINHLFVEENMIWTGGTAPAEFCSLQKSSDNTFEVSTS